MADKAKYMKKLEQGSKYPFPSQFGSHASMVDQEKTVKLGQDNLVACLDEYGVYVTEKNRLDSGCADPNRFKESRLDNLFRTAGKEKKQS